MNNSISHKTIWNDAAKSGLVLGLVTIVLMIPALYTANLSGKLLAGILNFALWLAKFIICIMVMKHYLVKFAKSHKGVRSSHTRRFGMATALASALIVAAFQFLNTAYINPDMYAQAMETAMESYSSMMTSSEIEAMRETFSGLPTITFFVMFFYCAIYGIVLSSILSRNIPDATSIFDDPDDDFTYETVEGINSEEGENTDEQ